MIPPKSLIKKLQERQIEMLLDKNFVCIRLWLEAFMHHDSWFPFRPAYTNPEKILCLKSFKYLLNTAKW